MDSKPVSMPGAWSTDVPSRSAEAPSLSSSVVISAFGNFQFCRECCLIQCKELTEFVPGQGKLLLKFRRGHCFDVVVALEFGGCLHALLDQEPDDCCRQARWDVEGEGRLVLHLAVCFGLLGRVGHCAMR